MDDLEPSRLSRNGTSGHNRSLSWQLEDDAELSPSPAEVMTRYATNSMSRLRTAVADFIRDRTEQRRGKKSGLPSHEC